VKKSILKLLRGESTKKRTIQQKALCPGRGVYESYRSKVAGGSLSISAYAVFIKRSLKGGSRRNEGKKLTERKRRGFQYYSCAVRFLSGLTPG